MVALFVHESCVMEADDSRTICRRPSLYERLYEKTRARRCTCANITRFETGETDVVVVVWCVHVL